MVLPKAEYPYWEPVYFAALFEMKPELAVERIAAAEAIMMWRLHKIAFKPEYAQECQAIRDTLVNLRMIQPRDWESQASSNEPPSLEI